MKIRLTQGPPVKGDDFFNREEIIQEIWDKLERSNVLLVAPRKFGKTSIMLKLRDDPRNGFTSIFFDIEHIESPSEFILELIEEIHKNDNLWKKLKTGLSSFFKDAGERIEEFDISIIRIKIRESKKINWKNLGKALIKLITENQKELLLILDEFPEMIKSMIEKDIAMKTDNAKAFLGWFRKIRLTLPDNVKLRFIVGGSICLESLLKRIDCIAKINDFERIKVGAFSNKAALEFIAALFSSEDKKADITISNAILEHIGTPVPFFIQITVTALLKESRNLGKGITPEFVKEVYERYLLGADYKSYFEHYYLRLSEYYTSIGGEKDILRAAKTILTEISIQTKVPKPQLYQNYLDETNQAQDEDGFGALISILEDEFYIEYNPKDQSYRFFSKILKDWWYRHFGMLKE
jgi:hypothetical protein